MPVVSRSPRDGSRVFKAQTKYGQHVRVLGTSNRSNIHGILRSGKAGRKGYKVF